MSIMKHIWSKLFFFVVTICFFSISAPLHAASVSMVDIDSGLTSPTGDYRWLNIADQVYAETYIDSYNYTQATVNVVFETRASIFRGTLTATNLKPNFAYQIKLAGFSGTGSNERIGLAGRWWQESWNGSEWAGGSNLNNKGDGSRPNPNDLTYFERRDIVDSSSPTGKLYQYTGYLPFDVFITDDSGNASHEFMTGSCFHVFWKTSQRTPTANDGPVKAGQFNPNPLSPAYDIDHDTATVGVFGEWERLPMGNVHLAAGEYGCQMILTEESFHGSGGEHSGNWAAAMGADISFTIVPKLALAGLENNLCHFKIFPGGYYKLEYAASPDFTPLLDAIDLPDTATDFQYGIDPGFVKGFFRLVTRDQ